jgi:mono/diheme cytochrome c family protein
VNGVEFKQLAAIPMPPMGLNDEQMADVLSYVRANFGNQSRAVKTDDVKQVRNAVADRVGFWTESELKR